MDSSRVWKNLAIRGGGETWRRIREMNSVGRRERKEGRGGWMDGWMKATKSREMRERGIQRRSESLGTRVRRGEDTNAILCLHIRCGKSRDALWNNFSKTRFLPRGKLKWKTVLVFDRVSLACNTIFLYFPKLREQGKLVSCIEFIFYKDHLKNYLHSELILK